MKKKNVSDLEKARDHFLRATTETIIGTGFALKGIKNLLKQRKGKKIIFGVKGNLIEKGFNLATKLSDVLTQVESGRPAKQKTQKKKMRKVKIE